MPLYRRVSRVLAVLVSGVIALAGCSSHDPVQPVLAARCMPIGGMKPVDLRIVSPVRGTLRVSIEQRGITLAASLASGDPSRPPWMTSAASPIERFGVATFAPEVRADEPLTLSIRSRDSHDITGEVCVSVDHLPAGDEQRLRAERAFAAASEAVQEESWQRAFDSYQAAARDFRGMDPLRDAQSRHGMAEIAYTQLRKDEGAYVLASWVLADLGPEADAFWRSKLLGLQARATLEAERFTPDERRARVFELAQASEALARQVPFGLREAPRFDIMRGFMEFRTGHTARATELFTQAAEACASLRDWACDARARQNVATMAEEARNYAVALQAYHDALQALPEDLEPKLTADIWGNYGRLQAMTGLVRQADVSHRKSIRLHADISDCDGTRMSVARLGSLLVQVGSIGEGYIYLMRAAADECPVLLTNGKRESPDIAGGAENTPSPPSSAACLSPVDVDTLSEAGKIAVFNALLGLREASRLQNDEVQAQRCLKAAAAYSNTARTRLRLANAEGATLIELGEPAKANAAFERGLAIADGARLPVTHENRSLAHIGLARASLLANQPSAARDHARQALALGGARADLGQVVDSLQLMARSYTQENATDQALSLLRVAANLIEQVPIDDLDAEQRATWLATQHTVFAELTTLHAAHVDDDQARAWEAFQVSERGRARSLRYALSQAIDTRAISSAEPASVRYRELMRGIADLARPAENGGARNLPLEELAQLAERHSSAALDTTLPADLRRRLGTLDATVVEYAAGREDMFAFVIDSEHIRVVPLGSRSEIAAAATGLYDRVRNPEAAPSDVRSAARRLAELALWPVTDFVSHRRVIFIPDDALHTVPFAVLPWSDGADAPLVVQRMELSVMPSTLFATRANNSHAVFDAAPRLELIGDPVFRATDWRRECHEARDTDTYIAEETERLVSRSANGALPRLPGSRKEVAAIMELAHRYAPASRVREHLGCEATPRALRDAASTSPTLLHIATHGYVDAYRPRLSALALTPDAESSGEAATFGLLEILQMKIASRLVVLSACDTSRGRLLPGEGVLGPAQAFLQAGAASVVASYWRIADEATAPFMRTFYRYLLVDHMTAAAALRQTQLDYARQGGFHDWAAFTLFGQPDTAL